MLDIIPLFFLCRIIWKLALRKGLKPLAWVFFTVISWIFTEMIGFAIGLSLLGQNKLNEIVNNVHLASPLEMEKSIGSENIFIIFALSLVSAFGGYLIVKAILEKKPDAIDQDDTNNIGVHDLRPPVKKNDIL
jgi:hypothetical protein